MASGLTIEPAFELSKGTTKNELGMVETTDELTTISLAALARYPIKSSKKLDLIAAGGVALANINNNPDGTDNATVTTSFALTYGLGVEYWYNAHWNVSAQVLNPIITYTKVKQDGVGGDAVSTGTNFGLVWEPNVIFMLHLFFE